MKTRRLGNREVSSIGLGAWPMSAAGRSDEDRSIRTIHAALDAGITLIDTADSYHWHAGEVGHNELLIAKALRSRGGASGDVLVASKCGHLRPGDGSWTRNGDPAYLKRAAEASIVRLEVESLALYQLHCRDPEVPYADSIGALDELVDEGKVEMVGISNVDAGDIRVAREILGRRLVSVQNEFSPDVRGDRATIELCDELDITYLPWSPLGGLTAAGGLGERHQAIREIAAELGISPQRVALAWLLALSPRLIAIPGATRPASIEDSARAADDRLSEEQLSRLDQS